MEQVLSGGVWHNLENVATRYNSLVGGNTWDSAQGRRKPISTPGTLKKLRVEIDGTPGAGNHYKFTLRVAGSGTSLTVTIADSDTEGEDLLNRVRVAAGEYVSLQCNPDSNPTVRGAIWSLIFESDDAHSSLIFGGTGSAGVSNAGIRYLPLMTCAQISQLAENDVRQVCPTAGKIKNMYVLLSADPGTAPDAYRFTLRIGGVSQTLTVTITADDISGNDTTHEVTVAAGDILTIMVEPLNGPLVSPLAAIGMTFVADISGESIMLGGLANNLHDTNTEYSRLVPNSIDSWFSARYTQGQECVLKKLHLLLNGSPGAGKEYVFTVQIGAVPSVALTVTIADANTTGDSGALEDDVADGDALTFEVDPDGTPDVRDAYWGLVCYIDPLYLVLPNIDLELPAGSNIDLEAVVEIV